MSGPSYPLAIRLSDKVTAYVGYKDDRVKIEVSTWVGRISLWMEPGDMAAVERVAAEQTRWLLNPAPVRFLKGAEIK